MKDNGIGIGLIHHGDLRCLCTSAVGFVVGMYHWSGREVTKSLLQNYVQDYQTVQELAENINKWVQVTFFM